MVKYMLSSELEVAAPAEFVWAVFSSKEVPKLVPKLLPNAFEKVEILEGDGGLGTVIDIVFPQGHVPLSYKEKIVTVDNQERLKETQQIEGGYLDMGVTFFIESFQMIEKDADSCIIKSTVRYEVPDDLAPNVSHLISAEHLLTMAKVGAKYALSLRK
ncbi:hypothetical protein MKX03_019815 [Papaver bracteatum]|nr:hypothetical protein MKX03_019815 [Papaver bracteatum]